jgi:hypothetical protein
MDSGEKTEARIGCRIGGAATSSRKFPGGGSHPEVSRNQPISGNYRLE